MSDYDGLTSTQIEYREGYLKSDVWQKKRAQRLECDGYKCKLCGSTENLNVHHISYANLGDENVENDLITLCQTCHGTLHIVTDYMKSSAKKLADKFRKESSKMLAEEAGSYCKKVGTVVGTAAAMITGLRQAKLQPTVLLSLLIKQMDVQQPYELAHVYAEDLKTSVWKEAQAEAKRIKEQTHGAD